MTAIDDKKLEIQEKIERLPSQVQSARRDSINKYLLSLEMQSGSGDALSDGTIDKCESLGIVKSAIKGKAASGSPVYANRHTGSYPFKFQSSYGASDLLSGPTTISFGFQFTPISTGTLTNTNCSNYYLVSKTNDNSDLELCTMGADGDAFSTPTRIQDVDLVIDSNLRTQGSLPYTFTGYAGSGSYITKSPIFKETGSTIDIFVSDVKCAEIDKYGVFTNYSNDIGVTIDADNSIFNFGSGQLDLIFTAMPSTYNAEIKLTYDYVASSVEATPQSYDSFNSTTYVFTTTLTNEPVLNTVKIKLNDEQKAMILDDYTIAGMTVMSKYSFYDPNTNVIKIRFNEIDEGNPTNTVVTEYTIKDQQTETSSLGSINSTSITYSGIEIPATNPDILEDDFKLYFVSDYTEETESRTLLTATLSGTTITGSYTSQDGSGTITGTIVQASGGSPGSLTITLSTTAPNLANPPSDVAFIMTFDYLNGRVDWESNYNYVPINSISTIVSPVDAGVSMTKINIASGAIDEVPTLLNDYHVRSYADHSNYGYITVVCWGLQVNESWAWYTGSASTAAAEACMELDHDKFVSLFGWMDLSNTDDCDIVASTDPAKSSSTSEYPEESGEYPYLYDQPFFPSTPPTFQESYLYRDSYHTTKKVEPDDPDYPLYPPAGLVDAFNYSVNSDIRWTFDVMPSEDDMMDDTYTFTNPYQTAIDMISAFSSAETTTIPEDDDIYASPGDPTIYTYSIDDTETGYYLVYVTEWIADEYAYSEGETYEFTCYFNDMQHYLHAEVNPIPEGETSPPTETKVRNIADDDSYQNVIDSSTSICQTLTYTDTSAETTFYAAIDTFDTARSALLSYNSSWAASFDTSSADYVYTTTSMTNYISASSTFSTAIDTELSSIGSRMGTPTSAGYVKNLYDAINLMLALDIEYIKELLEDFVTMERMFQTAVDDHNKWDVYNGI